jgi:hypothetical protein
MMKRKGPAAARQGIQTAGPIPDRRHFNANVGIPEAVSKVEEVVRKVGGNVCLLAGAGGTL